MDKVLDAASDAHNADAGGLLPVIQRWDHWSKLVRSANPGDELGLVSEVQSGEKTPLSGPQHTWVHTRTATVLNTET